MEFFSFSSKIASPKTYSELHRPDVPFDLKCSNETGYIENDIVASRNYVHEYFERSGAVFSSNWSEIPDGMCTYNDSSEDFHESTNLLISFRSFSHCSITRPTDFVLGIQEKFPKYICHRSEQQQWSTEIRDPGCFCCSQEKSTQVFGTHQ